MFFLIISSKALSRPLTTISLIFIKKFTSLFQLNHEFSPLIINQFKFRYIYTVLFIDIEGKKHLVYLTIHAQRHDNPLNE